jgi:hypothetical protein
MQSREIVRRTLDFTGPERVAHSFAPSDFVGAGPTLSNPDGAWRQVEGGRAWRRTDVWGNVWGRVDATSKGEVVQGALEDLEQVATFPLPDFSDPEIYADARERFAARPDMWHIGHIRGFTFSVARKMRKLEQYLMDLLLAPEAIEVLHDRVDAQIQAQITGMQAAGADCVMIAEDWGTQTQTLISPALWRKVFKPRFAALCQHAHDLGLVVFMHSCGKMTDIVPDLIETGVDLFQFDQPRIHGLDTLQGWRDAHHVTFWCPVDIQTTLQTKDADRIRAEAKAMLDRLWRGEGGFVAGFYPDEPSIGLEPTWQRIASETFLAFGVAERYAA